ncbi:MAG: hypothetical protein Q7J28_08280 [Caulobacter sp.]|nr:hypothetical protein [Caulobacter sp.]
MSRLAARTMDLAIARFPADLLPEGAEATLRGAAARIAPDTQLYFECRLAGDERAIDVSQHFFAADGGAGALRGLAGRGLATGARGGLDAWRRLAAFAEDWSSDADLAAIIEIGLEHDQAPDGDWGRAPAVFAAFQGDILDNRAAGARFMAAVAPGSQDAWRALISTVECARSHGLVPGRMVGVMLSRDAQLRCMVRGLTPQATQGFLTAIGWPGDHEALEDLLRQSPLAGDATRLVLGFGPDLAGDCGLEIIHPQDADGRSRLDAVMEWLVERGLADANRVRALARWPGRITPHAAGADWPDALIARDLATPRSAFDYFNAFISHVKINLVAGRALPAKAYLGLAPVSWRACRT